jgi:hypothetical protein
VKSEERPLDLVSPTSLVTLNQEDLVELHQYNLDWDASQVDLSDMPAPKLLHQTYPHITSIVGDPVITVSYLGLSVSCFLDDKALHSQAPNNLSYTIFHTQYFCHAGSSHLSSLVASIPTYWGIQLSPTARNTSETLLGQAVCHFLTLSLALSSYTTP